MLGPVLAALTFRCNNIHDRPVMNAIDLLGRYAEVETKVGAYAPLANEGHRAVQLESLPWPQTAQT